MKKIIIFDLDGTLLNTIADLATATNRALQHFGFPVHPTDAYRFFVGNGINKLFERALPEGQRTEENILRIRSRFIPYYNEHNADFSTPYSGISPLLQTLQEQGFLLAVASNKYQAATEKLIAHYFPTIRFSIVLGQREGIPVKPHPAIVNDILKATSLTPAEALYVGDSDVDMQTARNAGVDAVGVAWGFRPKAELEAWEPLALINRTEELLEVLDGK
ncbi:MAG: HAD family hydrolase [Bacteroides sp.]|nr:HAD family hydrolase [Bacteroides sp.]